MDGLLIVHAKTGHILFSKAYTDGFGLQLDKQDHASKKDPLVASMLLANFICAFYTNVFNLVDESVLESDDPSIQALLRNPLQSFDTGSSGPLMFFHRHAETNLLACLFLKRSLLVPEADSSISELFHECGEWLVRQTLHTFVATFASELSAKPAQRQASNKVFKAFLTPFEELYTNTFSQVLIQTMLKQLTQRWQPSWMYIIYSEAFLKGMEATQRLQVNGSTIPSSSQPSAKVAPIISSSKVTDSTNLAIVPSQPPSFQLQQQQPPPPSSAFIPHPPSTPAPSTAHAAVASTASNSSSSSFFASRPVSTRKLFPFCPPVRRWWHFGSRGQEKTPLFYQQLGRTVCFYSFRDSKGQRISDIPLQEEEIEPEDTQPNTSHDTVSSPATPLPSPDALHKLVGLVHAGGLVLSSPSEVTDSLNWMEVQLQLPSASLSKMTAASLTSSSPSSSETPQSHRLWILRIHDLLLCFPTPSSTTPNSYGSIGQTDCSLPALLSSIQPALTCLSHHYACVSSIHERNYRQLQKSMEKQQQQGHAKALGAK